MIELKRTKNKAVKMLEDLSEICIYIYIFIYIYIYLLNVTSYRSDNYVFNGEDKITKTINKAKK